MPFIDLIFNESTWDVSMHKLTVRESYLSLCILFTLSLIDVRLANQTFTNEMARVTTENTNQIIKSI
jgi:hypothetical protein